MEEQIQSQVPLINLNFVTADPYDLLQVSPTASLAEAPLGIHSPQGQILKSENYEDEIIEVMLPGHQGGFLITFSDPQESFPYYLPEIVPPSLSGFGDLLTRICVNGSHKAVNESGHAVAELQGEHSFLTATQIVGRDGDAKLFS